MRLRVDKRLKTAEKSSSTNFRVLAAPKSWSKYTTPVKVKITMTIEKIKFAFTQINF